MTLTDKTKNLIAHNEDVKKRQFFVVEAVNPVSIPKLTYLQEEKKWKDLSKMVGLPLKSSAIYRDKDTVDSRCAYSSYGEGISIELNFSNGLTIEDTGSSVSFWAKEDKSKVDMASAENVVRCVASHLYRRGFGLANGGEWKAPISDMREGCGPLLHAFDKAYKEADKMLRTEMFFMQRKNAKTQ